MPTDAVRSVSEFLETIRSADRTRLAGVIDFSYQHYALGDALTTEMNLACLAIERGCRAIDLYLIIDPSSPSAPVQGFITAHNYLGYLDNVLPAFLATPMLGSIHVLRDPESASNKMIPSDHTSVRASTFFADRICSGDMYSGVPIATPLCVKFNGASVPKQRDRPKSVTLISPLFERRMFSGLMSR